MKSLELLVGQIKAARMRLVDAERKANEGRFSHAHRQATRQELSECAAASSALDALLAELEEFTLGLHTRDSEAVAALREVLRQIREVAALVGVTETMCDAEPDAIVKRVREVVARRDLEKRMVLALEQMAHDTKIIAEALLRRPPAAQDVVLKATP